MWQISSRRGHESLQVLQVPTRELLMRNNLNLAIALLVDLNRVAEVASASVHLYAIVEELLESGQIEDLVVDGLGGIDDEL
jgi:hypothetical protein